MDNFEVYILVAVFALCLIYIAIRGRRERKARVLATINAKWGAVPEEEYTTEKLASIKKYYDSVKDMTRDVDDITWNDLEMDQIYMTVNACDSAIGEEYLYSILRKTEFEENILKERNKLIEFFGSDKEKRIALQLILSKMGKLKDLSVYEYIKRLYTLNAASNLMNYIILVLMGVSIVLFFVKPSLAAGILACSLGYNIITYFKGKAEFEKYLGVVAYVIRMLYCVEDIAKLNYPELEVYKKRMLENAKKLSGFKKNSYIVTSRNVTGSLAEIIFDYIRIFTHIDLIKFNRMLRLFTSCDEEFKAIFEDIGMLDSMISIASFRELMGEYCLPEFIHTTEISIELENAYHPMINEPVKNDFKSKESALITGSNASGKSTFIKTVAINCILAQTIYTVMADSYKAVFFRVMSSMALRDNLAEKESYYIVEIKSLKRIMDSVKGELPVLCFVDEVLRGTNTLERIAASSQILKSLSEANAICIAATHDIELTHILEEYFVNYHFQEQVADNDVIFDYKLYEGRAVSRNAIKLLGIIGYSDEVIRQAAEKADEFLKTGEWRKEHR